MGADASNNTNALTNIATSNDDNSLTSNSGSEIGVQGPGIANNLASISGSISVYQESPQAIAALNGISIAALTQSTEQVRALGTLSAGIANKALDAAKDALTPSDSRVYNMLTIMAGLIAAGAVAYFYFKKG